jgi:hypothetical protein
MDQTMTVPDCLMCAVRQLTEGVPEETWNPNTELATISGVVLRTGEYPNQFGSVIPFVDLWIGGFRRVRVIGSGMVLARALLEQVPKVGDRMRVSYLGHKTIQHGRHAGQEYRNFSVMVERGHH